MRGEEGRPRGDGDISPAAVELDHQARALRAVSRTFALTIPQLPLPLRHVVGNAYLLCRIADTVEDAEELDSAAKQHFAARFVEVVAGEDSAAGFAAELQPALTGSTPVAERELVGSTARVVAMTHGFNPVQRSALARCVRIMSAGMAEFQQAPSLGGLASMAEMDRYCYHVAGVVGEMLTELFCDYCTPLRDDRQRLLELAIDFGQGLQMTNILKDFWEDRARGACWLPADIFASHGVVLAELPAGGGDARLAAPLADLLGIATGHLHRALDYTLHLPAGEPGMRRFCLWALGMALLTLRRIAARPHYAGGQEVKISRHAVRATVALSSLAVRRDRLLRWSFRRLARALPAAPAGYRRADVSCWAHHGA